MSVAFKPVTLLLLTDGNNLFTITLNGSELDWNDKTYLTSDGNPGGVSNILASWSADGSRIAYTKVNSSDPPTSGGLLLSTGHIWIMNADGSSQTQLTFGPIYGALPSFSPDGKSILFTGYATGSPEMWLMNTDGTDPHPITHTIGSGIAIDGTEIKWSSHGSFSPNGEKIAYSSTDSGHAAIWIMNNDGSDKTQLTFPDIPYAPDANNPTWSPDSGKIVYFGGFERDGGYIFTINPDGSDRTQLTNMFSDEPSWSPDGRRIFLMSKPTWELKHGL
jgi:Tol biopolymer transport system component